MRAPIFRTAAAASIGGKVSVPHLNAQFTSQADEEFTCRCHRPARLSRSVNCPAHGPGGAEEIMTGQGAVASIKQSAQEVCRSATDIRRSVAQVRRSAMDLRRSAQNPLAIYLNDHLAGATAGIELARRVAAAHQVPAADDAVQRFAAEVAEDRRALLDIMAVLGVPVRGYKVYAAWLGEKAGRLKPNGRLLTRSPLSSLVELESLRLGVQGKAAGWRTLRVLAERNHRLDPAQLDELIRRARRQADFLERSRVRAAEEVITASGVAGG